ncbi:MAG TPA: SLC13 family permease [Mycobacteriales bacterium]|nr:SLC13 family permease [Mycobacteriales bacterium]
MWFAALAASAVCLAGGFLSPDAAWHVTTTVAPVLAFLVGITLVAELADAAKLFDVAAVRAARWGGGRSWRLYLLIVALGTVTTAVLNLDTTAVLLTPVVLALAGRLGLAPKPFAITAIWLACTASLLLPVSNLTNLLASNRLGLHPAAFANRMLLPELAAVAVATVVLGLWFRRDLRGGYAAPEPVQVPDALLFRIAAALCVALVPLFVVGVPVEWPALGAAAVLLAAFCWRRRDVLRANLVPWRLVVLVEGLFLVVQTLNNHGLHRVLNAAAGTSGDALGSLRTAGVGAGAANLVNNLPAYRAVELAIPHHHPEQLLGLLIGVNVGPLVLLWASLATLLWRDRCRARGVHITAGEFARIGLVGAPLAVVAAWAALLVTR